MHFFSLHYRKSNKIIQIECEQIAINSTVCVIILGKYSQFVRFFSVKMRKLFIWNVLFHSGYWFVSFSVLKDELHLEPGEYKYDYQLQLPTGLPTSIESQIGYIRYGVQVVLDRPRFSPDQKFAKNFSLIKPLNLNHDITLRVSLKKL